MKSVGSEVIADIEPDGAKDLDVGDLGVSADLFRLWEWLLPDLCFFVGEESPFDMVNVRLRGRVFEAFPDLAPSSAVTSFPRLFWLLVVPGLDPDVMALSALSFLIKSSLMFVSRDRILSRILCGMLRESYDMISFPPNIYIYTIKEHRLPATSQTPLLSPLVS